MGKDLNAMPYFLQCITLLISYWQTQQQYIHSGFGENVWTTLRTNNNSMPAKDFKFLLEQGRVSSLQFLWYEQNAKTSIEKVVEQHIAH